MNTLSRAKRIVRRYTAMAAAAGAVPLPSMSIAVTGLDAAMLAELRALFACEELTVESVLKTLGVAIVINRIGRMVFVETARTLAMGGLPFLLPAVSALGASTAGLQTWILGQVAIAIGQSRRPLEPKHARRIVRHAIESFPRRAIARASR
jgi:uncharacterized protein (DUF697 family)